MDVGEPKNLCNQQISKVNVGNDKVMTQSERNSHSKNQGGKTFIIRYLCYKNMSLARKQLFPNRRSFSYPNFTIH